MPDGEELSGVGRTSGARNELVEKLAQDAVADGKCAFCSPYFEAKNGDWVIEPLGAVPRYWKVWHNPSPFTGTSHHIMLASNGHILRASELTPEALRERDMIVEDLQTQFGYSSFTEFSRQGNPAFNAATVYHLHYHIVVSSGEPASETTIPSYYLEIIEQLYREISLDAEWVVQDPLEAIDTLREYLDVFREAKRSKAVPIRAKFSNKVGLNQLD